MDPTTTRPRGKNPGHSRPPGSVARASLFPLTKLRGCGLALILLLASLPVRGALRLDMFVGFDNVVPQGSWLPATFEIFNDGPPFKAVLEVWPGMTASASQTRRMVLELPTGTTKRFILPVYNAVNSWNTEWNAHVLDEKNRERAKAQTPRLRVQNASVPLAGAVSRHPPTLPEPRNQSSDSAPRIARIQQVMLPDNPLALQGLDTIYLSSEKLLEVNVGQANAILAWLHAGGHLIVSVEQVNHFIGPGEWLQRVLPVELASLGPSPQHAALQDWLTSRKRYDGHDYSFSGSSRVGRTVVASIGHNPWENLSRDEKFEEAPLQTAHFKNRDGRPLIGTAAEPLAVMARRGRGQLTVLAFAPELEPFKSWRNGPQFWAKITDFPPELLEDINARQNQQAGRSIDGIFGAMIDSDQVRKLPVAWLLLLLLAYLAVIGPLDHYWLKKINRQMLTWITFPLYVAFFSALIYFIGYKLRAGESEWSELHVIDIIPHTQGRNADLRGWTFGSIYSPSNARYPVESEQPFATLRGESGGNWGMNQESSKARVEQRGNNFQGVLDVPVWTSQLFVSDWWGQQAAPLKVTVTDDEITVDNRLDTMLASVELVVNNEVLDLGAVPARKMQTFSRAAARKVSLNSFVTRHAGNFLAVLNSRGHAFGDNSFSRLADKSNASMAISFMSQLNTPSAQYNNLNGPPFFELSPIIQRGDAVLLAFAPDYAMVKSLNKFNARRNHRDTLLRVAVEVKN
ncbi:MAG: hypothetical protein QOF48_4052 [Verrucomicrobiota bacterium]|jgi:hypothetical protein